MQLRKLGALEVSAIGLGCIGMSANYGPAPGTAEMASLIHRAVDMGVTFLATAEVYGPFASEERLAENLAAADLVLTAAEVAELAAAARATSVTAERGRMRRWLALAGAAWPVVGARDGIAPPSAMERRVAALKRDGVPVEFRVIDGVGHGRGLGTGTPAEGWVAEAIRFGCIIPTVRHGPEPGQGRACDPR